MKFALFIDNLESKGPRGWLTRAGAARFAARRAPCCSGYGRQTAEIAPVVTDELTGDLVRLRSETHYDSQGRVDYTTTNVRVVVSAQGQTLSTSYANAEETHYQYDAQGNTVLTTYNDGSFVQKTYDDFGRVTAESYQTAEGGTPLWKEYQYDAQGRLVEVMLPQVADPQNNNQLTSPVYQYGYDANGNQTSIVDPLGRETDFTYDAQGDETSRTLPIGVSTPSDPNDFVEHKYYDADGRLDYTVSFEGVVTKYVYDDSQGSGGRLAQLEYFTDLTAYNSNSPSEITAYKYDAFGRQVEVIQDGDGNLSTTSDQRVTDNTDDPLGELVTVASPEGVIHYEFDAVTGEHTETWTASDTVTTEANSTTDTQYSYDALGRLTAVTQDRRNGSAITPEATDYVFDLLGNLEQERLPNGDISDYTYDSLNRLTQLREFKDNNANGVWDSGVDTLLSEYDYTLLADGKRASATETDADGNTTTIDWLYDNLGRLTREVYDGTSDDYITDYAYDLVGNRLTKTTEHSPSAQDLATVLSNPQSPIPNPDEVVTSTYDANDRLLTEADDKGTGDTFTVYGYGTNNSGTQQTSKVVHQGLNDQGTVVEQETYGYNLQGQMSQTLVDPDGTGLNNTEYDYKYDADNIRVSQAVTTDTDHDGSLADETPTTTKYVNDKQNPTGYSQVLEERDIAGVTIKTYKVGLTVDTQQSSAIYGGGVLFLLKDGHNSTRMLVDATGQPLSGQVFAYDAFGNRLDTANALTLLLYNTEQSDLTGLDYFRSRYYRPETGTFTSFDSYRGNIYDPLSLHKYLMCHGDTINYNDPTGRDGELAECLSSMSIGLTVSGMSASAVIYTGIKAGKTMRGVYAGSLLFFTMAYAWGKWNVFGQAAVSGLIGAGVAGLVTAAAELPGLGSSASNESAAWEIGFTTLEGFVYPFASEVLDLKFGVPEGPGVLHTEFLVSLGEAWANMIDNCAEGKFDKSGAEFVMDSAVSALATIISSFDAQSLTKWITRRFALNPSLVRELTGRVYDAMKVWSTPALRARAEEAFKDLFLESASSLGRTLVGGD